jgi:4-oxalocrotonate tautomerase
MLYDGAANPKEGVMPEIVFYALGGRSVEQKRALIKDFTDAVVKNYNVDASSVTITIVESAKEDKAKGGVLFSDMTPKK